jgi:hypothetical protein
MNYQKDLEPHIVFSVNGSSVPVTLFVAMNMVDRFISMGAILVEKVQLVGGICLLVASKYKEICTHGIEMHDALLLHQDEYRGFKCSEPEYLIEIY